MPSSSPSSFIKRSKEGSFSDLRRYRCDDRGHLSSGGCSHSLFMDPGNAPGSSGHWTIHRVDLRGTDCFSSHDHRCFLLFWNDPRRSAGHSHLLSDPLPDRRNLGITHCTLAFSSSHRRNIDRCSAIGLCLVIICSIAKIKLTDTIRP